MTDAQIFSRSLYSMEATGRSHASAQPGPRLVHPLHLAVRADGCLQIAHAPEVGDRRNFDLPRISRVEFTGDTFASPADFKLEAYLAGGLDRFLGEPRHEVVIRFRPAYLAYVRVHRRHPAETFADQPDGGALSTFYVNHLLEVVHLFSRRPAKQRSSRRGNCARWCAAPLQALVTRHDHGCDRPPVRLTR